MLVICWEGEKEIETDIEDEFQFFPPYNFSAAKFTT